MDFAHELDIAERAARAGAAAILSYYRRDGVRIEIKPDNSPVTEADLAANQAIIALIRASFPSDAILSEELPDDRARLGQRRVWIVDPLDGTRDFIARTDHFCTHVGLAVDGVAVVGAVLQPVAGRLFSARAGAGASMQAADPGLTGAAPRTPLRASMVGSPGQMRAGVGRLNPSGRLGACLQATGLGEHAVALGASAGIWTWSSTSARARWNGTPVRRRWWCARRAASSPTATGAGSSTTRATPPTAGAAWPAMG